MGRIALQPKLLTMKKTALLITTIIISYMAYAQNSGTVYYEEKTKLHFNIQGDAPPPANLPTERTAHTILNFTSDASLYQNNPNEKNESGMMEEESEDGGQVRIRMDAPDNRAYCDLKNNQRIEQRDFMQRKFLIESDLKAPDWKITGNQKKILSYPCQEATRQDSDRKITVWFTAAIPISYGPSSYTGLPGLVLEVSINDGDQTIIATSVKPGEVNAALIVKPKEGKKVTQEEFKKIVAEKMKEMGVQNGNGGNAIIRIENH